MQALNPNAELPVRVITPHDGADAFRYAFSSLTRDWRFSRDLAWRIFVRDTQAGFRGSFLGWFWMVLPVLANSLVWMFLSGTEVVSINTGSVPYPLFVLVGNVLWTAFNGCFVGGLGVLSESGGTLSKVSFPHEALLLVVLWKSLLNVGMSLLALPPFLLYYSVDWQWTALLFPMGILLTMLCGLSLGLILVPVAALFSDISRAVHLALRFLFFLTPVIFPLPPSGCGRQLMLWHPATSLIVGTRSWFLGGEVIDLSAMLLVSGCSLALLIVGILALKVAVPHIIERLGGG
ncbi:MAG: ABC transporter permease [Planctomyces sp.]